MQCNLRKQMNAQKLERSVEASAQFKVILLVAIVVTIALRLYLVSDRDILAVNQGVDDLWHIQTAAEGIWSGNYNHIKGVHLPVYALWLRLCSLFGMPSRFALDLLWCFSSLALGLALYRWTGSLIAGLVTYIYILFHPAGITLLDRALAENILPPLVALCIAFGMEYWQARDMSNRKRWALGVIFSLCCGAAYNTRREGIVLLVPLLILPLVWLWPAWRPQKWCSIGLGLFIGPLVAITLIGNIIAYLNFHTWGFCARSQLLSPGYTAALKSLYSIKPTKQNPHYVTITAETRHAAYAISPTFSELKPFIEEQLVPLIKERDYGIGTPRGEIPDGWFYWDIREAAARAGWHQNAAKAEGKYDAIAMEIRTAINDGRIASRPVFTSSLSPEYSRWVPLLPDAAWSAFKLFLNLDNMQLNFCNRFLSEDAKANDLGNYFSIAGRRRELGRFSVQISGWIKVPSGSLIAIGNDFQPESWTSLDHAHPTEEGAWLFNLYLSNDKEPSMLWLRLPNESISFLSLKSIQANSVMFFDNSKWPVGVDIFNKKYFHSRAEKYLDHSIYGWRFFSWLAFVFGIIAFIKSLIYKSNRNLLIALIVFLSFTGLFSRCLMMAMVGIAAWPLQYRYLFPALPFLAVLIGAGVATLSDILYQNFKLCRNTNT
jgi:hypothetical protein